MTVSRSLPLVGLAAVLFAVLPTIGQQPAVKPAPKPAPKPSEWPMFGGTHSRNPVNLVDKDILRAFDAQKGIPLLWKAKLGSRSYAQPVVAGGRVFVGTNNENPRNKRDTKRENGEIEPLDKGVLICFDARTGEFLWQSVHDKLEAGQVNDWPKEGMVSIPAVDGDRLYYVTNRCTVVCADVAGFANGNQGFQKEKYQDATDADIVWEYDMMKELKVFPHNMASGCPLVVGDVVYTITGNGVDENHLDLPFPDAPSLIALNKTTGKLIWKDSSPGRNVMHGQWAPPAYTADPVPQVIVGQGDGWLRAFDPATGTLLWKFDCNPKGTTYDLGGAGTKSDFIAAPVVANGRVYIGVGQDPEHWTGVGHLWCMDLARAVLFGEKNSDRDVSPRWNCFDPVAAVNRRSALAWHYGGEEPHKWAPREFKFGRTMSTVCVVGDVVYAAELGGQLHCLDARTGKQYWEYDTKSAIWGAPYYVDGRVLLGTEFGDLFVFRHDPKPEVIDALDFEAMVWNEARLKLRGKRKQVEDKYLIGRFEFDTAIRSTPSVSGGVLFLATENTLYAVGKAPGR